jgi:hypothetical protein
LHFVGHFFDGVACQGCFIVLPQKHNEPLYFKNEHAYYIYMFMFKKLIKIKNNVVPEYWNPIELQN